MRPEKPLPRDQSGPLARRKQQALESRGLPRPELKDTGVAEPELIRWYFEERLHRSVPADLAEFCRLAGFLNLDTFRRALVAEFCSCTAH